MVSADFLAQVRVKLSEKSEHWSPEELFAELQRAYKTLQLDLPFFIEMEVFSIEKGINDFKLKYRPIKSISMRTSTEEIPYVMNETFYKQDGKGYTFLFDRLLIRGFDEAIMGEIVYRYTKELKSDKCLIEIPYEQMEALRLLLMHYIHEKPVRNTKERDLSIHYLKLYQAEKNNCKLRVDKPTVAYSTYKRI